jgi:hypothetical protein
MSERVSFTPTEALKLARAAFDDAMEGSFAASIRLEVETPRQGEPSLLFEPSPSSGLLHEEILQVADLAERHQGRMWMQRSADWCGLTILWPVYDPAGPGGTGAESPAKKAKRAAKGDAAVRR